MTSSSNTTRDHAPSAARRKRLKDREAETGKSLQNVLDSYPIEKYYSMADRLLMAFQLALDERRLDDAYVFGLRFATFSMEGLPKHGQHNKNQAARDQKARQVDQVLTKMDLVATRMDAEERLVEKKHKEAAEARRRQEQEQQHEQERKRHAVLSEKQRYTHVLRQQRDELLAQQKAEQLQCVQESKQRLEQRALEKLKLLNNQKTKPQQPSASPSSTQPAMKLFPASVDGSQRTAWDDKISIPAKQNSKSTLFQSTLTTPTSNMTPSQQESSQPATNKQPAAAAGQEDATTTKTTLVPKKPALSSVSDASLVFPKVPTEKPKMNLLQANRKQPTSNTWKNQATVASTNKDKKKKSEGPTFQASVFASAKDQQPKRPLSHPSTETRSSRSAPPKLPQATNVGIRQPASTTVPATTHQDNKMTPPKNAWWDTSDSAAHNASKPWWQRDVPTTGTNQNSASMNPAPTTAASKPDAPSNGSTIISSVDPTTENVTSSSAPNKGTDPAVVKPTAQPPSKVTRVQQKLPKKASTGKKVMPTSSSVSALSTKGQLSSEGYEITMGSTTSLRVVETEPEEDPYTEESFRAKLTPQEAKTVRLLEHTINLQESRLARLEASNERTVLRQEAKRRLQQGDRKGALYCLAKKKRINQTIDVVKNAIFNMETQLMMLESTVESREVGMIMKEASDAMASLQNGVRVSDFTDERVGDLLSAIGQGDMDYDEEELLSELNETNELDMSMGDASSLLSLPSAPQTEVLYDDPHPLNRTGTSVQKILASLF